MLAMCARNFGGRAHFRFRDYAASGNDRPMRTGIGRQIYKSEDLGGTYVGTR